MARPHWFAYYRLTQAKAQQQKHKERCELCKGKCVCLPIQIIEREIRYWERAVKA